jgi:5-methyltetrahydrofolate--homocysteine methyltransferase
LNITIHDFETSIVDLDIERATATCKELIKSYELEVLFEAIGRAMDVVGEKYEKGEYFLSELFMAGQVVKEVLKLTGNGNSVVQKRDNAGIVVLATVKGDLHDIGKNIVAMLLRSSGFNVIDLGTDVSSEQIAVSVKESGASILGLSALLTTTVPEFGEVVTPLRDLKRRVKVIVGGAAVNETALKYGVDAWTRTAVEGLKICKRIRNETGSVGVSS